MDAAGVELCRKLEEKVAFIALNKKTKYLKILIKFILQQKKSRFACQAADAVEGLLFQAE